MKKISWGISHITNEYSDETRKVLYNALNRVRPTIQSELSKLGNMDFRFLDNGMIATVISCNLEETELLAHVEEYAEQGLVLASEADLYYYEKWMDR